MHTKFKKTIIICILKILYNYTSFDYPVTQTTIVNYLNDIDIECTRKTVGRKTAGTDAGDTKIHRNINVCGFYQNGRNL